MTPDEMRARNFLDVAETAEILDVDTRTVYRAIEAGQLPAIKVSTKTLIPAPRLADLIDPRPDATPTPGVNEDGVRAAIDLIRAGIAALEVLLEPSGITPGINDSDDFAPTPIRPAHGNASANRKGDGRSPLRGDAA